MSNFHNFSDLDLARSFQQGDVAAFEELYSRYWSKLYSAAYKRLKSREISEEIVQDLFTSLWVNRQKLVIHTSIQSYLFNSVRYLVFAHYQKETSRRNYAEFALSKVSALDHSTEEAIACNDLKRTLDAEMDHLPTKCRSVFELSRKQYKSNKEIAYALGISEKTVENHITKALKILKVSLKNMTILYLVFRTLN